MGPRLDRLVSPKQGKGNCLQRFLQIKILDYSQFPSSRHTLEFYYADICFSV